MRCLAVEAASIDPALQFFGQGSASTASRAGGGSVPSAGGSLLVGSMKFHHLVHFLDPSHKHEDARLPNEDEAAVLAALRQQITTPFDEEQHTPCLRALWDALHPPHPADVDDDDDEEEEETGVGSNAPFCRKGEGWQDVGFQHTDPASDVRGGGELALQNLLYFAAHHTEVAIPMCRSRTETTLSADDDSWPSYPWATAGINLTQLLAEICHVVGPHGTRGDYDSAPEHFWHVFSSVDDFHELYSMAFVLLDCLFDEMDASYLRFNEVIAATRERLLAVLAQSPSSIDDVRVALRISILQPMVGSEMHKQLSMHGNTFAFAPNADGTNNVPTGNLMAGWLLKLPVQDPSKHGESTNSGFWSRFHQKKDQRSSIAHSRDDAFPEAGPGRSSSIASVPMSTQSFGSTSTVAPPSWKWQRRFVALEANGASGPTLMYFKSALTPPQRRIAITAECMAEVVPTDRSHRTFVVQTARETLWLQAFNETDAAIWVQRLQLAIRAAAQHAGKPRHDVGRQLFAGGLDAAPPPVKPRRRRSAIGAGEEDVSDEIFDDEGASGPSFEGVLLTRKTRAALGWKKRFAVLTGDALQVYRNDKSGQLKLTLYAHHLTIQTVGVRGGHGAASAVTRGAPADSRFRIFDGQSGTASDWAAEDEKTRFLVMNALMKAGAIAVPDFAKQDL